MQKYVSNYKLLPPAFMTLVLTFSLTHEFLNLMLKICYPY